MCTRMLLCLLTLGWEYSGNIWCWCIAGNIWCIGKSIRANEHAIGRCVTAHSRKGIGLHVLGTLTTTPANSGYQGCIKGGPPLNISRNYYFYWKPLEQNVSNDGFGLLVQVKQ